MRWRGRGKHNAIKMVGCLSPTKTHGEKHRMKITNNTYVAIFSQQDQFKSKREEGGNLIALF
jgi:hypothetical protein